MSFLRFYLALFLTLQSLASWASMPSIEELTLEEKVGQLLMPHFNGEQINEDAQQLISKAYIGGIIYFRWANGLKNPEQVQTLSYSLQKFAQRNRLAIPLWISVDQEGGTVSRLTKGFTIFPDNLAVGQTKNPAWAEAIGEAIGKELLAVGVNMNLAPVIDINSNPQSFVMGVRAFGDSKEAVAAYGHYALLGYRKAQILCCFKHFPGYGEAGNDPHFDLPVVNKSQQEIRSTELYPYFKLASEADAIMSAHVLMPAFDSKHCATLSTTLLQDVLRREIGYQGLIISDSLVMQGLLNNTSSIDEAAIEAFNAGCDILILGGKQLNESDKTNELQPSDVIRIHGSLVQAVKDGRISISRLDSAVAKILKTKDTYRIDRGFVKNLSSMPPSSPQHRQLAKQVAKEAFHIVKNNSKLILREAKSVIIIAPTSLKENLAFAAFPFSTSRLILFFDDTHPSEEQKHDILAAIPKNDIAIIFSTNAWKREKQLSLIREAGNAAKQWALLVARDPQDAELPFNADFVGATYSPAPCSLEAAIEILYQTQ